MQYDTYNTHEVIFDMYQQYIFSGFIPKKIICSQISLKFGNVNNQNNMNLSKIVLSVLSK